MNQERLKLLETYIKSGVSPLLVQNISSHSFQNAVIIPSNIDPSELNGHYEHTTFCPPIWYQELVAKGKTRYVVLVIENINKIPVEEQTKFIEILKYQKVSTFAFPKNCLIVVTCFDLDVHKIHEEVYSLLAQI